MLKKKTKNKMISLRIEEDLLKDFDYFVKQRYALSRNEAIEQLMKHFNEKEKRKKGADTTTSRLF
ncbi:MAG: CopG family ribbon-helix-helix protein [Campylobacterota bacterium]